MMATAVSDKTIKALKIIKQHQPVTPASFARLMWPDSPGHNRYHKAGPKGSARGTGMNLAAGGYLGRLKKRGLADWRSDRYGRNYYRLTEMGQQVLREVKNGSD